MQKGHTHTAKSAVVTQTGRQTDILEDKKFKIEKNSV